jgi:hypothetical protein
MEVHLSLAVRYPLKVLGQNPATVGLHRNSASSLKLFREIILQRLGRPTKDTKEASQSAEDNLHDRQTRRGRLVNANLS